MTQKIKTIPFVGNPAKAHLSEDQKKILVVEAVMARNTKCEKMSDLAKRWGVSRNYPALLIKQYNSHKEAMTEGRYIAKNQLFVRRMGSGPRFTLGFRFAKQLEKYLESINWDSTYPKVRCQKAKCYNFTPITTGCSLFLSEILSYKRLRTVTFPFQLGELFGIPTSTIYRFMKRHGYSKKGKYLLPCLSPKQMNQRLRYCMMHRGEKFELWIDIDEKVCSVSFIAIFNHALQF